MVELYLSNLFKLNEDKMNGIVINFWGLFYVVLIVFTIIGIIYIITANKPNNALRIKLNNIWKWLINEGGRPFSPSTNEKTCYNPGNKQESSEFIQQVNSVNDSIKYYFSSIDNKLTSILDQQKLLREEQERLQRSYKSICTQHAQQMAILSELKASMDTTFVYNQKQEVEGTSAEYYDVRSFKELYCRQLSEGKDGFKVNDLTDCPNGSCYIIKQYDDTHATINIVKDPLVRSQMITGFTDFIAPICDFDGQSPVGKDGFEVKEAGELEIFNEKWLIKKKIKIQLI